LDNSANTNATRATLGVSPVPQLDYYEFVEGLAPAVISWDLGAGSAVAIRGGAAAETFALTSSAFVSRLSIDGGGGVNTLDYSATTGGVVVNLPLQTATGLRGGIANIQNVTGSAGNDVLVGDAQANVLRGGPGRDLLIGGRGADLLDGGAD